MELSTNTSRGRLAGLAAVVTGAGSGIGRAIALLFGGEGAWVLCADLDGEAAGATAAGIGAVGGEARACAIDVARAASVRAMVDAALTAFGRLDILVNNAGVGVAAKVADTAEEDWDRTIDVNLKGVFLGCKYAVPAMLRQGGGCIINLASVAGLVGVRDRAAYCASKGGVIALTRAVAVDHAADGIRVNCICPGTVDSPWIGKILASNPDPAAARKAMEARQPQGRLGRPEEIAQAALYLASPEAAFVTGSCLVIDGGMTAI